MIDISEVSFDNVSWNTIRSLATHPELLQTNGVIGRIVNGMLILMKSTVNPHTPVILFLNQLFTDLVDLFGIGGGVRTDSIDIGRKIIKATLVYMIGSGMDETPLAS